MPVDWKELHLDESSPRFWGWVLDTHLSKFNSRLVMTQNQRSLLWGYTASMLCSWVFISRLSRLQSPAKVNMAFQPTSSPLAFCFMKCSQECDGFFSSCSPKTSRILQPVRMHLCPLGQVPFGGRNEAALCLAIMGGLEAQEGHGWNSDAEKQLVTRWLCLWQIQELRR